MILRSLSHRNFRLYLGGQFISLIGTWMQQLAVSWLVYRMTHSTFWLGTTIFCSQIPTFFIGIFAGVLIDRANRLTLLKWTQALLGLQALVLAALTFWGRIHLSEILALSIFGGIVNAIDIPTRQAFVVQMIQDRQDLPNAIALNSTVMNGTRLLGPALAGVCIATLGEGVCFLINALSYLAVLYALMLIRVDKWVPSKPSESIRKSLKEGITFAFGFGPVGTLLILLTVLSLVGTPYTTLLPAMADRTFKGGANTLGILNSASGLGALGAALFLASRKDVLRLGRYIAWSGVVFAFAVLGLSLTHRLELAMPLLFLGGVGMMLQMAASNILIQTVVDDDKRGRVMSLFALSLTGLSPFGSLWVGALAEKWGIQGTLMLCGVLYLFVALWYLNRLPSLTREVEPVYVDLGIVSENQEGFVF